jgi:predicted MFS family arabinose efflux permease
MLMRNPSATALRQRLLPLHVAVALQGFMLWVPIEKLFMNEIGFDPAAVGAMAAAYAAVVPLVEIPSGILADRWSRRGVLAVASAALTLTALVGGISHDVPSYIASALLLGVYFAMYSGTLDAIVYDTVLEETGGGDGFEKRIGRVRAIESAALVASALAGGWLAGLTTTRTTYFLTIPFAALSIIALLRFREPQLHKTEHRVPLGRHLALTFRTLTRQRRLLPIIALAVLTALLVQTIFEFGPLWLVALAVPAVLYGPYWAALMTTLGIAGVLAGRFPLHRPVPLVILVGTMIIAAATLATTTSTVMVTIAQVVLALLTMLASIHVTQVLHDVVPSTIRTGVASGVGALSWIAFLPFALLFGLVSNDHGVHSAGWILTATTVLAGLLLARVALAGRGTAGDTVDQPALAMAPVSP